MYQTIFLTVFMGIVTIVNATSHNKTIDQKFRDLGGNDAQPGEFPHIVSIQVEQFKTHHCSGSIIHPQWILTAAHCFYQLDFAYVVKAGKHNLYAPEPDEQSVMVERIYKHDYYNEKYRGGYDIALLKLERELELNDKVHPIALPVLNSQPKAHESLILAGWGRDTEYKTVYPNKLQKKTVHPVDLNDCKRQLGWYDFNKHNLCTTGVSACWGDRGGPLINEYRELIGIHSWGDLCCCKSTDAPDVHIRVFELIDWMKSRVPLEPIDPSSSSKLYLSHLFIPLQICSLFGTLQFNYSL